MTFKITDAQISTYQAEGVVCLKQVFDKKWIELLHRGIERNLRNPTQNFKDFSPKGTKGGFVSDMWAWQEIAEYEDFVRNSDIGEIGARLNQKSAAVFMEDNFFIKQPLSNLPTPWHQDIPYYEAEGDMWSVWIPLDSYNKEDSLELIAGSHKWGKKFLPENFKVANDKDRESSQAGERPLPPGYERLPDFEEPKSPHNILSWEVEPGDCLVFDARTIHGNRSTEQSKGGRRISFRFIDQNTSFAPNKYPWGNIGTKHDRKPGEPFVGKGFPIVWPKPKGANL